MKTLYTTTVLVEGGRNGCARSDDGLLAVDLALPAAIGGTGAGTNPEQLFAAGFAGCFCSSLAFAGQGQGAATEGLSVAATVSLGVDDAGTYGIKAELAITLPNVEQTRREAILAEARRICAYTNATRGNVDVVYRFV